MQPDLIVLAPDAPDVVLIAEVKQYLPDRRALEARLKVYMLDNLCRVALLVTPLKTWIYHDTLHDFTEASIREVGEFNTVEILGLQQPATSEGELFHSVREWLERLASAWPTSLPIASGPQKAVVEYLVPAVSEGRVFPGSLA